MNAPEEFRSFAAQHGYELPANIEPGRKIRFSTNGKRGDEAGWAFLFPDCLGGVVGDWRSGEGRPVLVWQAERAKSFSAEERRAFMERVERQRREAQEQRERDANEAAARAQEIWASSRPAKGHAYLTTKGIPSYGLKVYAGERLVIRDMDCDGALILPLRNAAGEIRSLEFISPTGEKRFLPDADYRGCFYSIGGAKGRIAVCEGFATGGSIYKATGTPVRVAATAGNLVTVAKALREAHPEAEILICADNDHRTVCQRHKAEGIIEPVSPFASRPEWCKCNPGITSGIEAGKAVGGTLAFPDTTGTDFNDLAKEQGDEAVKQQIEAAKPIQQREQGEAMQEEDKCGPEPLPELPEVPPFSYEFLPGELRAYVQDISERMQCPPEFAAVGTMVMAGSAIGRKLGIRPKQSDSWTVIPNLWGMLVGRSGVMKSPALAESLAPIKRMEKLAFDQYEEELEEFALTERAEKIRASVVEQQAKKELSKNKGANLNAMLRSDAEIVEPVLRRYIVNDSTPEALCETLKNNPQGVMVERDELIGLLRSMDREGNQEARALYLTAADGDKSFTVDRIMRGSGRHIEGLCVSIVGGIQPGVLAAYVRETQRSGAGDDGLLQRFGLMVYPDVTEEWKNIDRKPNAEARDAVRNLIERLCNLTPEAVGAETDGYGVPFVRFDSSAYGLFVEWLTDMERKLRFGDDHPSIISHLSKYRKMVPALALINHLSEGGTGPVTEDAISRALLFSEFLEAHARRVYSYAARPDFDAAKTILAKLRSGKLPIEFTARDVYRPGWSGLTTAPEADAAIKVLIDFKWITEKPMPPDSTGRPTRLFVADPMAKEAA
jgi:putative DNA primase/helicase